MQPIINEAQTVVHWCNFLYWQIFFRRVKETNEIVGFWARFFYDPVLYFPTVLPVAMAHPYWQVFFSGIFPADRCVHLDMSFVNKYKKRVINKASSKADCLAGLRYHHVTTMSLRIATHCLKVDQKQAREQLLHVEKV